MTPVYQMIIEVRMGNYYLTDLKCADDKTLFCDTVADLVAGIFQEEEPKFRLHISWGKNQTDAY